MQTTTKNAFANLGLRRTSRRKLINRLIRDGVLDLAAIDAANQELYGEPLNAPLKVRAVVSKRSPFHYVYIFRANGLYKIGRSVDPEWRLQQIQTSLPYPLEVVHLIRTTQHGLENSLHRRFNACKQRGEWFALTDADVQWIKGLGDFVQPASLK